MPQQSFYVSSVIAGAALFVWQYIHIMVILLFMLDSVTSSVVKIIICISLTIFSIGLAVHLFLMYKYRRPYQHLFVIILSVPVLILEVGCYFAPIEVDVILFFKFHFFKLGTTYLTLLHPQWRLTPFVTSIALPQQLSFYYLCLGMPSKR